MMPETFKSGSVGPHDRTSLTAFIVNVGKMRFFQLCSL